MRNIVCTPCKTDIHQWLTFHDTLNVEIAWLGQAGFVIRSPEFSIGIDLYLSDSLYRKYQATYYPHRRMIPPPCSPTDLRSLNLLLSTHGHTDHMDGDTLEPIFNASHLNSPTFICPRAEVEKAHQRHVPLQKIIGMSEGETLSFHENNKMICSVTAIPAAHEELEYDLFGNCKYLGYIIELSGIRIFHSGDSIPYDGFKQRISSQKIDFALLPVNGRDEIRRDHGVPGNFTVQEAVKIVKDTEIPVLIPHHFGMFDFNTVAVEDIIRETENNQSFQTLIPEIGVVFRCNGEE